MGCLIMFLKHDIGSIDCIIEIVKNNRNFLIKDKALLKTIITDIIEQMLILDPDLVMVEKNEGGEKAAKENLIVYKAKLLSAF